MTTLSVCGLEPDALAMLKHRASEEKYSVNVVVLRMIRQGLEQDVKPKPRRRFTDLNALASAKPSREIPRLYWGIVTAKWGKPFATSASRAHFPAAVPPQQLAAAHSAPGAAPPEWYRARAPVQDFPCA